MAEGNRGQLVRLIGLTEGRAGDAPIACPCRQLAEGLFVSDRQEDEGVGRAEPMRVGLGVLEDSHSAKMLVPAPGYRQKIFIRAVILSDIARVTAG